MKSLLGSVRHEGGLDRVDRAVRSLEEDWRRGEPDLEAHWAGYGPDANTSMLAALIKADLRCRFVRGGRPAVNDYLERFPELRDESDRVLSLIYEEFCLREEQGERPDTESFCRRYAPWRDSLASQLKYHQLLSRVVNPAAAPTRFPEPGEHFQEFAIDSVLGQGGAARVYRARNDLLGGREVALKVSTDRGQEPSIMGRLDHEHIVPVHSVVFQPETRLRGLIMPYRAGLPLDEVIRRVDPSTRPREARAFWKVVSATALADTREPQGRAGWGSFPMRGTYAQGVAWIIAALARAVAYAHAREIQHRDIKPANILLTLQNGPQLLDFNLAHDPHAAEQAEAALRGGTLPYMAPEQLEAFLDPERWEGVGTGADLYSLGLVMHELLTGQAPEVPDQSLPLPRAIRSLLDRRADLRFAPRRLNPSIPHALEAIAVRCLAYSRADRYESAQELADDLHRFLARQPLRHAVNPSAPERLGNWTRRHVLLLGVVTVAGSVCSYPGLQRLYPVEHRSAFRAARAALNDRRPYEAIALLEPLVAEFPDSPLARFHLAAAHQQADHLDRAADHYGRALLARHADGTMVDWGRSHPDALGHFEALGLALADASRTDPGDQNHPGSPPDPKLPHTRRKYPDLARVALRTALRLGSTSEDVSIRAAVLDELYEDYDAAWAKLTTMIRQIEGRYHPRERDQLLGSYDCFLVRARVSIRRGEKLQASGPRDNGKEARRAFAEALEDLDRGRLLIAQADDKRWYTADFLTVQAELGLGDLDSRLRRRDDALAHYRRAEETIKRMQQVDEDHENPNLEELTELQNEAQERIENLSPKAPVASR